MLIVSAIRQYMRIVMERQTLLASEYLRLSSGLLVCFTMVLLLGCSSPRSIGRDFPRLNLVQVMEGSEWPYEANAELLGLELEQGYVDLKPSTELDVYLALVKVRTGILIGNIQALTEVLESGTATEFVREDVQLDVDDTGLVTFDIRATQETLHKDSLANGIHGRIKAEFNELRINRNIATTIDGYMKPAIRFRMRWPDRKLDEDAERLLQLLKRSSDK